VLTKTAAPEPVVAEQNLTYTFDVDNTGTAATTSVVITDFPAGTPMFRQREKTGPAVSGTLTCWLGSVAAGAGEIITLMLIVKVNPTGGTIVTNRHGHRLMRAPAAI
jgi:uncharacterized repeat protein (TIGR01451 family)